jgi:hypothetical protein
LIADCRQVKTLPMERGRHNDVLTELTAALDWWRGAGVDHAFEDAPRQWLAVPDAEAAATSTNTTHFSATLAAPVAAAAPAPMIGGDRADWPGDLAEFRAWWLTAPSLDGGQVRDRVPPRGPAGAPLMVLVPEPEAADSDILLSGKQGRLLAAMLSAMGYGGDQVYVASVLPRHTPMADWAGLAAQGLGAVLLHHIALAAPQRLIAFGRHILPFLGPALLGNAPPQTSAILPSINHEGGSTALLQARDLGSLLERPIAKGAFWQHWLEFSGG